ncbi:hypothetical protein [Aureimonas ureilytica]|uniref:hypothetical protein n=1 Tax=Aureimonas ureilytica TaxID=401562 RepID=UPI00047783F3|nr:hypothetical protein [Aureimonas ureilytica]
MRRHLSALVCLAASAASAAPAYAADYSRAPAVVVTNALVPTCENPRVMAQVEDQFEYGAPRTIPAALQVVEFSDLYEKAYQPRDEYRQIERRYCQGTALISSGERRTLYYVIEYPMGYAGVGWRAEGCVLGLDPWKVYGANCESLRRF